MRQLIVGQITGVSQFAAVIAPAVLCRPHRWPSSNQATTLESQPIQGIQYVSGQTLSYQYSLPQNVRQVIETDLTCSESTGGWRPPHPSGCPLVARLGHASTSAPF